MPAKLKSECSPEEWAAYSAHRAARSYSGLTPMHREAAKWLSKGWRRENDELSLAFSSRCSQQRKHHLYLDGKAS